MLDLRDARHRWPGLARLCGLLFVTPAAAAAAPPAIDTAWRERVILRDQAELLRDRRQAQQRAQAALEAANARGDTRARLQAASRYVMTMDLSAQDCAFIDQAMALAQSAGPDYASERFDIATMSIDALRPRCASEPPIEELEALARQLGDPARRYFLLEAKANLADRDNHYTDAIAFRVQQLDHAITNFQRASALLWLAQSEFVTGAPGQQARQRLEDALRRLGDDDFPALRTTLHAYLYRVELAAGELEAAFAHMRQAEPGVRAGLLGARESAFYLVAFSQGLIKAGRPAQALALLDASRRFQANDDTLIAFRSRVRLSALMATDAADAHARGLAEVQTLQRLLRKPEFATPQKQAQHQEVLSQFYEKFGDPKAALQALKAATQARAELQRRASETARAELHEKLNVAAKDQENAQLKAHAELQAARQRGWIVAFSAAALGVAAAGAALAVAMRRGRRLAQVSAELAQRNDELERRSASRIRLLAAACHDLRQPAHALGLLAEMGGDAQHDPARFVAWLQSVRRSTASLGEMLDELMDLGRLDGGHYTPQLSDVSLAELLHEVMLHFGGLARRKGLMLEVPPVEGRVVSDRHLLRRIVFNLVSNAIKYTDTGAVRVSVDPCGDDALQLTVQDSGPGIPPDKLDDVFRDYVRLNPAKATEGLGIGLSIVRRAAELLGHALTLTSAPGQGTTVRLQLPQARAGAEPAVLEAADAPPAGGGVIALLDDDLDVREAMAALLRRWGYTVHTGAEADAVLRALAPGAGTLDLIITDLHLATLDGVTEVSRLRQALHAPDLPALLVTGDLDAGIATQAAQARVYVANKPLAPRRLALLVGQLLRAPGVQAHCGA